MSHRTTQEASRMNSHRSSRGRARVRIAFLCVVALLALPLVSAPSPQAIARDRQQPLGSLYLLNRVPRAELQPLDPATLFNLANRNPIDLGRDSDIWNLVISKDGTTVVTVGQE